MNLKFIHLFGIKLNQKLTDSIIKEKNDSNKRQSDNTQFPKPWPLTRRADKENSFNVAGIARLKSAPSNLVSYHMATLYTCNRTF